jgi:hypothetical protein
MSEIMFKLVEAEYFLSKSKEKLGDPYEFYFNLDAFLSAARSVTWIMQKEYSKHIGFNDWYINKQEKMRIDSDFKFFNDLRVATIHKKSVKPYRQVEINISDSSVPFCVPITEGSYVIPKDTSEPQKGNSSQSTKVDIKHSWCFQERPKDNGFELCNKYIQKLREWVEECDTKFRPCEES